MNQVDPESGLIVVEREEDIPCFASEAEEREFWDTHALGDAPLERFGPPDDEFLELLGLKRLAVTIDEPVAAKLGALAAARGMDPESLAARLLAEAVDAAATRG